VQVLHQVAAGRQPLAGSEFAFEDGAPQGLVQLTVQWQFALVLAIEFGQQEF